MSIQIETMADRLDELSGSSSQVVSLRTLKSENLFHRHILKHIVKFKIELIHIRKKFYEIKYCTNYMLIQINIVDVNNFKKLTLPGVKINISIPSSSFQVTMWLLVVELTQDYLLISLFF